MQRREAQARADRAVNDAVHAFAPSDPRPYETAALSDFTAALRRARAAAPTGGSRPANLGGEHTQAAFAEADAGARAYGRTAAEQLARIDAPMEQRIVEANAVGRAGSEVAMAQRQAEAAQFIAELRARARRANPWVSLLSRLAQQVADHYDGADYLDDGLEPIGIAPKRSAFDVIDFTGAGDAVFSPRIRNNPARRAL